MSTNEIRVPDIGDFKDVPIIEVHVQPGSQINVDDPLISLESDKATMEVPASQAGTVKDIKVKVGDRVSMGDLIVVMEGAGAPAVPPKERITEAAAPSPGGGAPGYGSPSGVYESVEIKVPDIGDFKNVPIIEVHVQPGATVSADDPLISLESDKATMEVPAPQGGTVKEVKVKVGDRVSEGDLIVTMAGQDASAGAPLGQHAPGQGQAGYGSSAVEAKGNGASRAPAPTAKPPVAAQGDYHAEVLVLGAGPGGYPAAFRAADLGKKVVLVERWPSLGGVCLNVGCIPSKALLHAAKVIDEAAEMGHHGVTFDGGGGPSVNLAKLRGWKDGVAKRLPGGLSGRAKQRKVTVVGGLGKFASPNQLVVEQPDGGAKTVTFEQAIIAAGSEPVTLPFIPHGDPRVIDSTGALELGGLPKRLLVIGGGIIGLEMATVYNALGAKVTIVELMDQIIPGADKDI